MKYIVYAKYLKLGKFWIHLCGPRTVTQIPEKWGIYTVSILDVGREA